MIAAESILVKYLHDDECLEGTSYRSRILDAMEEYGVSMYNQAIESASTNAEVERIVIGRTHSISGAWNEFGYIINKQSILKLKK